MSIKSPMLNLNLGDSHSMKWLRSFLGSRPLSFQLRLVALASAIPLLVLSFIMFNEMVRNEREGIRQGLLASSKTLARLVESEIETHAAIASALALSPSLLKDDLNAFWKECQNAVQYLPGSWLSLSRSDGQILFTTLSPPGTALPHHASPDVLERGFETGRYQVSNLVMGPVSHRLVAFLEMPVFRDGKPAYSLSLTLPPERFLALIKNQFPKNQVVAVLDRDMKFIARVPGQVNRLGTLAAEGWRENIARAPEGWSENLSVDGKMLLTGYTPTAHGWTVGVAELQENLAKPLNRILWSTMLAATCLVLLSLGLAWWLSSRAGSSMALLAHAARALGNGKPVPALDLPFIEARIIAGALTDAANELQARSEQIDRTHNRLETEVAERTQELVTEMGRRSEMEAALRQTQKMEAIGQLTGGIAHDFNNMLTIVIGNLDTLQRRLPALDSDNQTRLTRPVEAALKGARSAAKLTHRLLAFARQQPLAPTPVDMRAVVIGLSDLLTRTVSEDIKIEIISGAGLWPTLVDANQLENTLLNLVINSRDAMPDGGRITIETSNAYLDQDYATQIGDIKAGQYAMLSVSDSGSGIPSDQLEKVFEPFYTTKEPGRGTGLGLAMIHGFVKQSGGHIRIYSETGHGTTVKIYLPRLVSESGPARVPDLSGGERADSRAVAGETILLVEDNDGVRDYATGVLEELGYRVLAASNGEEALQIFGQADRVDLLFTDVVLGSGMNGRILSREIAKLRPGLPVLFTTGYTKNAIVHRGQLDPDVHLLTKPYTNFELSDNLRALLDTTSV